ncbi:APC family permease [Anditalea andensis]|uniref:Amino acid permease n=1 Tax=Anditalea andensis TaxID=1048983 RepID=A0A074KZE2_9BACT|nr:amino acid permease [Anditalea andensis]KEO75356.1 amino acid permease [Anditalea andensis]
MDKTEKLGHMHSGTYPKGHDDERPKRPEKVLSTIDVIALIVGIVIGAGIFRVPSLVAANTANGVMFMSTWVLGGLISLVGAMCYAELTTTYPNTGGDYHFLRKAYGNHIAFLFAWSRMSVVQSGSIALLAYIFGDYASQLLNLGQFSSIIYASFAIISLTAINILGVKMGSGVQKFLTAIEVVGIIVIIVSGLIFSSEPVELFAMSGEENVTGNAFGLAMVFVLLTFGGWNEAAYISAELQAGSKKMVKAFILGIFVITSIYFLINLSFLKVLGLQRMAESNAVASDLMMDTFGNMGVWFIVILVAVAALTSANATIFTGARSNYALGRDFPLFAVLGKWDHRKSSPVNAFLIQGLIALGLVSLGLLSRDGFEAIVEYTAPVFWFFFLLVGVSLFVLRSQNPERPIPFRVPLYPITPIIFCLTSAYLLYSSIIYTGLGALVGIGVLFIGALLLLFLSKRRFEKNAH